MESETLDIKSILEDLGYKLQDSGPDFWMTKSLDRGNNKGQNLSISKKTGMVLDFSGGSKYSIEEFIKLNNGNYNIDSAQLENFRNITYQEELKLPKVFDKNILEGLIKDYSYWENRGIDKVIFDEFTCGIFKEGKMAKRHCTVIYGQNKEIAGISGRALENWMKPKWKHLFKVSDVCFPLYLNKEIIKEKKEVILVESLGNLFSLWSAGIKNVICIFGTRLQNKVLSNLISLNLKNIIVSLDNDSENHNVGNLAAEKIKVKLGNFFDDNIIKIILPPEKDWNETLVARGPDFIEELFREKGI